VVDPKGHTDRFPPILGDDGELAARPREALEERLRWLEAVVALSPMAIWIADGEGIVYANSAAAELVGAPSAEALVGVSIYAMVHDDAHDDLRRKLDLAQARLGHLGSLPARLVCLHGEMREVEIGLGALPDHGRTSVQMVLHDVTERRRLIHDLEASRRLLRRLSANAVEAREEERRRIARELHDELGQSLTAMKMDLVDCGSGMGWDGDNPKLANLLARIDEIMASVRRLASDLRPQILDDLGLGDAIEALADDFSKRQDTKVRLRIHDLGDALDERVTIALYRMVQEALTNVARHARATLVSIELRRHAGQVVLEVQDNGVGMPESAPGSAQDAEHNHFGVLGMQERTDMLGGDFEIGNAPGGGAFIRVRVPLRPDRAAPRPRASGHAGGSRGAE
jgi:two-component system, NarL family, sensor histidine kinase UhpB